MHQAIACAEAKATLISPFVGPHPRLVQEVDRQGRRTRRPRTRASQSVTRDLQVLQALRLQDRGHGGELPQHRRDHRARGVRPPDHRARTSSRSSRRPQGDLPRKLDPAKAKAVNDRAHRDGRGDLPEDARGRPDGDDKLAEGIEGFTKAIVSLEKLLGERSRLTRRRPRSVGRKTSPVTKDRDGVHARRRRRAC